MISLIGHDVYFLIRIVQSQFNCVAECLVLPLLIFYLVFHHTH